MVSLSGMGVYADGAIITFGMQFVGFAVAAILQTEVFYDILGGINFLTLLVVFPAAESSSANTVFLGLFAVSRGWLLVFLAWRAHDRKGDARFDGIRNVPSTFFIYWMVQAVWVYCISLPLLVVSASDGMTTNTTKLAFSSLMLLGMALSIFFEILSDVIKAKWVSKGRIGGFCTDGPWNYSRHPNYAGEILTWVFAACYAVLASNRWWASMLAFVSPLFTMHILLNVSGTGVWNAEGKNLKRYYEHEDPIIAQNYEEYRRTTPSVFPTFPIPYESLPLEFQRRFCFEWERYEYKPSSSSSPSSKGSGDGN